MIVNIKQDICTQCGKCYEICPVEAIKKEDSGFYVDNSLCINCLACERECPVSAVTWDYDEKKDDISDEIVEEMDEETEDFTDCKSQVNASDNLVDKYIRSMPLEQKKKTIRFLRFIVEDNVAVFLEKMFLLFIDGVERLTKKK